MNFKSWQGVDDLLRYKIPCLVALIATLLAWLQLTKLGFVPLVLFSIMTVIFAGFAVTDNKTIQANGLENKKRPACGALCYYGKRKERAYGALFY